MLLHMIEAARPVDAAIHPSRGHGAIDDVEDLVVFEIANVEDIGFTELAAVMGLTAGSGVKMSLIEQNAPAAGVLPGQRVGERLTAQNLSREIVLKRVVVIEAASGHGSFIGASLAHVILQAFFATVVGCTRFSDVKCR